MLTARLVVGADGANSWLRKKADIPLTFWDYRHHALVATIRTEEPHQAAWRGRFSTTTAFWRSCRLSDPHLCSIVWSVAPEEAERLKQRRRRRSTRRCAWPLITALASAALKASGRCSR